MAIKTHTIEKKNPKHSQEWSWDETPEVIAAIEQLEKSSRAVKELSYKPKPIHTGNSNA